MKTRLLVIIVIVFAGLSYETQANAEECNYEICIIDMNASNVPIARDDTYFLDVIIDPNESLHAKIINWDDEVAYEEILNPTDEGKVSVSWKIPNEEKYLGTYRVALTLVDKEKKEPIGLIFRVGDDPYHPRPMQFVSVLIEATGKGINTHEKEVFHKDETLVVKPHVHRWDTSVPPFLPITILVNAPDGNLIEATQISADDKGYFEYFFTPTKNGMHIVELKANFHDFNIGENVETREIRTVPVDLKNKDYSVFAEGEDFPLTFREDHYYYQTIKNIDFSRDEKRLSIEFEQHYQDIYGFDVIIPHKLLDGNHTVFLNDKMLDPNAPSNDLSHVSISKWEGFTVIDVNVPQTGIHKVDIYGTTAIPEFETLAAMILAVSILPIALIQRFKISKK